MDIAVLDVGTRATRLLFTDPARIREAPFDFAHYRGRGLLTEAGAGLDPVPGTDLRACRESGFRRTFRAIVAFHRECLRRGLPPERIHAVGTEVLRVASDASDLVARVRRATGIDVRVLEPEQEAETVFWAARAACRPWHADAPFLVIEQGGGSLQVALAASAAGGVPEPVARLSVPELGTVLLRRRFLDLAGEDDAARAEAAIGVVRAFARERLDEALDRLGPLPAVPRIAFGLGLSATGYHGATGRRVHGRWIPRARMEDPGALPDAADASACARPLSDAAERRLGLPCYGAVLDRFGLDGLRVCGAGLRHGVALRIAAGRWPPEEGRAAARSSGPAPSMSRL